MIHRQGEIRPRPEGRRRALERDLGCALIGALALAAAPAGAKEQDTCEPPIPIASHSYAPTANLPDDKDPDELRLVFAGSAVRTGVTDAPLCAAEPAFLPGNGVDARADKSLSAAFEPMPGRAPASPPQDRSLAALANRVEETDPEELPRVFASLDAQDASSLAPRAPAEGAALPSGETAALTRRINPFGRTLELDFPVSLAGSEMGELPIRIAADDRISFDAAPLLALIGPGLDPKTVAKVEAAIVDGRLTPDGLTEIGLPAEFDPGTQELRISPPIGARAVREIALGGARPTARRTSAAPARFSAFINARAGLGYTEQSPSPGGEGRDPLVLGLDGGLRLFGNKGVAVQFFGAFDESQPSPWRWDGWRATYDDTAHALRWTIGDLSSPVAGFQSGSDFGGIIFARNFALQPNRVTQPRGSRVFEVDRPTDAEIEVNGLAQLRTRLAPGRYELSDFLSGEGRSDVVINLTDDLGQTESLRFSAFSQFDLLEHGLDEFALAAGVLRNRTPTGIRYEPDHPYVSAFYRRGLTDSLTLGADAQYLDDNLLLGAEGAVALPIGSLTLATAASRNAIVGWGGAARADYQLDVKVGSGKTRIGVSAEAHQRNFGAVGDVSSDQPVRWQTQADISSPITKRLSLNVGGGYTSKRAPDEDAWQATTGLSWTLGSNVNFNARVDFQQLGKDSDVRGFVGISWRPSSEMQADMRYDTGANRLDASVRNVPGRTVNSLGYSVDLTVNPQGKDAQLAGSLDYLGNRFEGTLQHELLTDVQGLDIETVHTQASVGVGIGFAGGKVAVGRPVSDAFAIVDRHSTLAGHDVTVDPDEDDRGLAYADALGPALVGDLSTYRDRTISYDVDDLPVGYDLGEGAFTIHPPLASGYVLQVGSAAAVTLITKVVDKAGNPVANVGGRATPESGEGQPVTVFTNRVGRLAAPGLAPGKYRLTLFTDPESSAMFDIPANQTGLYRIEAITIEPVP